LNYAKRIDASPTLYSCGSGYNFYFADECRSCKVFHKSKSVVQHAKTKDLFYITPFPEDVDNDTKLDFWVELIRKPANLKHYIWPVDIIATTDASGNTRYALVFPFRELPTFENISSLLAKGVQAGWEAPWVQKLVANLLDAWCDFDDLKYVYHEFSVDNMFYQKENFNVMFDFSFSIHKTENLFDARSVSKNRIAPDFADSYYYTDERQSLMDLASDYYSIAVILFRLMIGRLPYQGKVMEHEPNDSELEHENWLEIYHKNTYFIFDIDDATNQIGGETGFAKDELYVDRWNGLPTHIKNMFHNVFQTANVMRMTDDLIFYSPHEWKEALSATPKAVELNYRYADAEVQVKEAELISEFASEPQNSGFCDVILTKTSEFGKTAAIKIILEITGLGLASATELYENTPVPIVQGVSEDLAKQIQAELFLSNAETTIGSNTKHNEQLESYIWQRMQGHWQHNA